MNDDILFSTATAFHSLLNKKYIIKLGRKGKSMLIHLSFDKSHFHHLAGLHKLSDMPTLQKVSREYIFDMIINKKLSYNDIKNSNFIHEAQKRLTPLFYLEQMIDSNELVFRYLEKNNPYSKIKADFLLQNSIGNDEIFIFLDRDYSNKNIHFCRSIFSKEYIDYAKNQPRYTVLEKRKIIIKK